MDKKYKQKVAFDSVSKMEKTTTKTFLMLKVGLVGIVLS